MIRYRRFKIYEKKSKTNIPELQNKSGVYMIYKDGIKNPVYIGYSGSNIYKTLTRHFQSWNDNKQVRVTYPQNGKYSVSIVICTPQQAERLERYLIKKYKPVDNPNKLIDIPITKWDENAYEAFGNTEISDVPF
jgi:excinuclease UvrABC nuclease subunit